MDNIEISYIDYYNNAINNIANNNISESIILLEKAYYLKSNDIEIINLLGLCYFKICNFKKALKLWEKSKSISDNNTNKAIIYLDFINSEEVNKNRELYIRALSLIDSEEYEEALEYLLQISKMNYGWIDVDLLIALIYIKKKQYNNANKYLEVVNKRDKGNELAKIYKDKLDQNKKYKIRRFFFILIMIIIIIMFSVSIIVLFNKNKAEKMKLVSESITLNNDISFKDNEIKNKTNQIKEKEEYIKELEKKLNSIQYTNEDYSGSTDDKEAINKLNLGLKDYKKSDYTDAIDNFKTIINSNYDNYLKNEAVFWCAQSYEKIGEYDLAIDNYKYYIKHFFNECYYDDSLYRISMLLEEKGDSNQAKIYAEKLRNECRNSMFNNNNINSILKDSNRV